MNPNVVLIHEQIAILEINRLKPSIGVTFQIGNELGDSLSGDPKLGRNDGMPGMILDDGAA
jgi:hypothetical protein